MNRIMIIGCGGAGKSTLSLKLHEITGIELIHLDQYYWKPSWVETSKAEWEGIVRQLSNKQQWIIDGNYGGTMDMRLQKADTIIFLDRTKWLCLFRVLKRLVLNYGRTRADMRAGCKERFNWEFMRYVYNYNKTRRPKILEKLNALKASKEVVLIRSNREMDNYLRELKG